MLQEKYDIKRIFSLRQVAPFFVIFSKNRNLLQGLHLIVPDHVKLYIYFNITQVYMPSMLTVMLSWLTFWVDMDAGNQVNVQFFIIFSIWNY